MATYANRIADLHKALVDDERNGYSQYPYRWGEDGEMTTYNGVAIRTGSYDCSSSTIAAIQALGIPTGGASYTGNMEACLTAAGSFKSLPYSRGALLRGDIILNPGRHVTVYQGDGLMSTFDINELGGAYNGRTGDQTGREAWVRPVYDFGQSIILRCVMSLPEIALDPRVGAVHRFYNRWTGEHMFTTDANEAQEMAQAGWSYERAAWVAPASGVSVWRLYNPNADDHLFTTDVAERDALAVLGWRIEGLAFSGGAGSPVWRLYNPHTGRHHFTLDPRERDGLVKLGWRDEGAAWMAA